MNKIFECIVGSHAYGTNIETSDIDIKGVYQQPNTDILGLKYQEQLNPDKDTTYYEIRRFIELASSANPTILEMLFVDPQFIKIKAPVFELVLEQKHKFLTKNCLNSFGGYAVSQIQKAKGLNKKMNWEKEKTIRKTPIDFCFIQHLNGSTPIENFLKLNHLEQQYIGLSAINNMPNCYLVYYDYSKQYGKDMNVPVEGFGYKGIQHDKSNSLLLSSIPKEAVGNELGVLYYNKDAYSIHCKDFNSYQEWLRNRNTQRYVDVQNHNQQIDGKNMSHCIRLLECAEEIALTDNLTVLRPNREYLLSIRKGEISLSELIEIAEEKLKNLTELFNQSNLPESVDFDFKHNLLNNVRSKEFTT